MAPTAPTYPYTPTDFGGGDVTQQQRQIGDARRAPAPLGFDARKWADPTQGTSHKYTAGSILAASGSIGDILRNPQFKGWTQVGPDKIKSPEGNIYDEFYDYGGPNQRVQHTLVGGPRWDAEQNNGYQGNRQTQVPGMQRIVPGSPGYNPSMDGPKGDGYWAPAGGLTQNSASSYPDAGAFHSNYTPQFSDPGTNNLERLLMAQSQALETQRANQGAANQGIRGQMTEAQAAQQRLTDYLSKRAGQLQGPAYTGTEQEVLRTQLLDPIERDRTAANQRALQNIGARGLDPTSGIAMELQNNVNRGYDQQRAQAQGDLAYRTINEQRSRQQEAQSLLGMIPQVQRAGASGDLQLLQALDAAMNAPRQQQVGYATILQHLPAQAQQEALAAMQMGPTPDSIFKQAMGIYDIQQQQQGQNAYFYQMLGQLIPYLIGGGKD